MLIYRSRVFDLYTTNVASRQFPLEYVAHKGSCAVLLLDPDEHVGLIAHHRPAIGRTLFELPMGTLDRQQSTDDLMSLVIKDEVGLHLPATRLRRITSVYPAPGYSSELLSIYVAQITAVQRKIIGDNLRWFHLRELNHLIRTEELVDLKTVMAVTAYQAIAWPVAETKSGAA
jgi:ADP-ribose pyrophosphatase